MFVPSFKKHIVVIAILIHFFSAASIMSLISGSVSNGLFFSQPWVYLSASKHVWNLFYFTLDILILHCWVSGFWCLPKRGLMFLHLFYFIFYISFFIFLFGNALSYLQTCSTLQKLELTLSAIIFISKL